MPGINCSVLGCGCFQIPAENVHKELRKRWLSDITKSRVVDVDFRRQVPKNKVHTYEKHFLEHRNL